MNAFIETVAGRLAVLPPVRVLYTDLDGTLLGPGGSLLTAPDGSPSTRAAAALADAAAHGLAVVPVSGRQRRQLQHDARILGLSDVVAEAGTVHVRDGEVSYAWGECPPGLGLNPHQALAESGAVALLLEAFDGLLQPYEPWHRGREGSHLLHGRIDVDAADELLAANGFKWARVIDNGAAAGWQALPEARAYHVVPRGVGKAAGVAEDLAARGLDRAQAAAIGDSPEDATMSAAVGVYFQVANGRAPAGADAVVTPGAMGDGFAQAVAALLAASGPAG